MALNDTSRGLAKHQAAIEALARETDTEPAYVQQLYDRELAELEANAKIHGYLSILASRKVRRAINLNRASQRR